MLGLPATTAGKQAGAIMAAPLGEVEHHLGAGSSIAKGVRQEQRWFRRSRSRGRSSSRPPQKEAGQGQTQRSWAAVAKFAEKGYALSYIPPKLVNGKLLVRISNEVLEEAHPKWKSCLVGYYVGRRVSFKAT